MIHISETLAYAIFFKGINSAKNLGLITGALHSNALDAFNANPRLKIKYFPDCSREVLFSHLPDCNVLVTRSETDVTREVIDAAPLLKVIARAAVGVGNIDITYASEKGILVINCPGKNTNSAAEMTLGLLLGMFRNLPQAHEKVKSGGWDRHRFTGRELRGKKIGIVGLGNVGHRVAKFCNGFDMDVYAYDPYISPTLFDQHSAKCVGTLKELASIVDVMTFHVPLNKETKGMVTPDVLQSMKPGSWIVNAARGGIYRELDVIPFLKSGHLAGLAVDTFETEPNVCKELLDLANVWVAPHIGASTVEAQLAIGDTIYDQVIKSIDGGVVDYPVNLPQVGVISDPKIKAYSVLAEKLGSLAGQLIESNPQKVEILYRGDLAGLDHRLIRLSFMKGYASRAVNDFVSFVNAESHMSRLGIAFTDREEPAFDSYRSALKVRLLSQDGISMTVGGIVFDDFIPRLSLFNDFYFETEPNGHLLFIENEDKPGVVGDLGQFLGDHGINIATFELSRNKRGGKAMAVIRIDQEITDEKLEALSKIRNLISVHKAYL
ncbi:MAG: phosphoglycerate dehydrogenase [Proteobacteria bacterium]|nr:phosphoglycerate dehydrogenase [Pseudomonadota bacterium]